MAQDPRRFTVDRPCPTGKGILAATNKKDTFSLLGKVGDLEVLNEANNEIGQGLRTLGSISDSIRNRNGIVPEVFRGVSSAVDAGTDAVLSTLSFNPREVRDQASRLNPGVANRALGQARDIYDSVTEGRFDEFEDLPGAIQDFQNLEVLVRGIVTGNPRREDQFSGQCVSPYAIDLVARAPKHKFMYVVEFVLSDPYASSFDSTVPEELAFVVKRSSRPNISFEYEEVNFYNFRSKVLKRHEYQPMSMSFYDDHNGKAITFWNSYLKAISPLSNFQNAGADVYEGMLEQRGMDFENNFTAGTSSLAPRNTGAGSPTTIISHINLYHFYKAGSMYDVYTFLKPKISELQLDELDMTQTGDGNEVAFTFAYDALFMDVGLITDQTVSNDMDALTDSGEYSFKPPVQLQGPPAP